MWHSEVPEGRLNNEKGSRVECPDCADSAQVVVQLRGAMDEMGPCPTCSRGYRLEFGLGWQHKLVRGELELVEVTSARPLWGVMGYWRGRTWQRDAKGEMVVKPEQMGMVT